MALFPPSTKMPLLNTACPWSSSAEDLKALYECPHTQAITVRTSLLKGFAQDDSHRMTFFGPSGESSSNCYGYSPIPLDQYLPMIRTLLTSSAPKKRIIISITGSVEEMGVLLSKIQKFAQEMDTAFGVEFNASCPNFKGKPPPAYNEAQLTAYLTAMAPYASPLLLLGIKLPPYTYESQFTSVINSLQSISHLSPSSQTHPISFLTATNTLGQGVVFSDQIFESDGRTIEVQNSREGAFETFALPQVFGGLAGASLHQLALGNVYRLTTLLKTSSDPKVQKIQVIGAGGAYDVASVERFRKAGASAVGCATGLGREGVAVFARMAGAAREVERIPVLTGARVPLLRASRHDSGIHGNDGLGGVEGLLSSTAPTVSSKLSSAQSTNVVAALAAAASALPSGQWLTIVATGALTNVALFVATYPELVRTKVDKIVLMGGAEGRGNRAPLAEFNILIDPEAAAMVFDAEVPVIIMPLNITHQALFSAADNERLLQRTDSSTFTTKAKTPLRHALSTLLMFFAATYKEVFDFHSPPVHDPLCIAYLSHPHLFKGKRYRVDVELGGSHTAGATVVDVYDYRSSNSAWDPRSAAPLSAMGDPESRESWGRNGKNVWVAEELDVEGFWKVFQEAVDKADKVSILNA
ncbi:uridine nucleosidase Urh1 [Pseudohyphozyma bogoriensis]|nr:uridine nucleosidase Urh1 [Pseudohyphozyma bogoriensis]